MFYIYCSISRVHLGSSISKIPLVARCSANRHIREFYLIALARTIIIHPRTHRLDDCLQHIRNIQFSGLRSYRATMSRLPSNDTQCDCLSPGYRQISTIRIQIRTASPNKIRIRQPLASLYVTCQLKPHRITLFDRFYRKI